jgi:hypothetical protein
MAIVKYKDSKGNWVEAPEIFCGGSLRVDVIQPMEDGVSFDLRKYQNCNRFLMYYTGNLSRSLFDSTVVDGYQYLIDADAGTITSDKGFDQVFAVTGNDGAIATKGNANCYTYENGIFTWILADAYGEKRVGDSALVIYAA